MPSTPRSPSVLLAAFDSAIRGTDDIDPYDVLGEILDDLLDTVRTSIGVAPQLNAATAQSAVAEVEDYVANHYPAA